MSSFLRKFSRNPLYLKKSQMSLFDWQPTHEEERTIRATERHLASGEVVQVKQHERKTKVKDSLHHRDTNYRYKDVGNVPGSRKELAAEQAGMLKQRAKTGSGVNYKEINWDALEENPREAFDLITKDTIAKEIDWEGLKAKGVDPGAAFLMHKLYTAVAPKPEDSPEARHDFVFGINALQDRFSDAKTVEDVKNKIDEIREEMTGFTMDPEQQKQWDAMESERDEIYSRIRKLKKDKESVWDAYYKPSLRLQNLKYEQEKRTRRGWKPDPDLARQITDLSAEVDRLYKVQDDWRTAHQAELYAAEKEASENHQKRKEFKDKVVARNIIGHPLTRGWNSFGKKFFNAINYSSYKGSDSFATHMATARSGKIQDWNWLEKNAAPRAASQQSVRFEMKVADRIERIGGNPLPKTDYGTGDLQEEFHLANVQSGNWVLKDLNAAKHHTEQCAMALQDMGDMLGVPYEEISFNGRLSVAFGARGSGGHFGPGAAAHYENKYRVINLTKMKGGGSLAHEYFHFLDDVIGEVETGERSGRETYATDQKPSTEVLKAFKDLVFTMEDGNHNESVKQKMTITEAEKNHWLQFIDRQRKFNFYGPTGRMVNQIISAPDLSSAIEVAFRAKQEGKFGAVKGAKAEKQYQLFKQLAVAHHAGTEGVYDVAGFKKGSRFYVEAQKIDAEEKRDYWSTRREMAARAFAAYMSDKLHDKGRENTYLTSYADNKYYILDGIKPYPEGEERKSINAAFDRLFDAVRSHKTLQKSQMNLFDWQPTHDEIHARQATERHLKTGAVVHVSATQAKVKVKDHPQVPKGTKVYYKTPEMNRKKKGFIAGGTHEDGYHIQPVRGGYTYKPEKVTVHRDHIWTQDEHDAEQVTAPKLTAETSVQRKETAEQKTGYNEGDVLKHPTFVTGMRASLGKLAATNGFNPHYQNINGVLLNDDPEANELYSEYVTAAMGAYRAASAKATPEDIEELHQHLSGVTKESRIIGQMHRTGRTAALRHLITNNNRKMSEDAYDSAMEDDMESGMRSVSAAAAVERANQQTGQDKASIEAGVMEQIKGLDDPVAEYILTAKFGLGNLEHAYKEQDIASALNKRNIPTSDGEPWNADKVKGRMKDALAQLARTRGVQDLRGFLKSLRDLDDLRKSMPTKREMQLAKVTDLMERYLLVKSHIKEYTKQDGTVVQAHDDKRQKHDHIGAHELGHGEQVHAGATLEHGKELVDHLQSKGWKHKEVSAVRRNESLKVGDKKDMPKPPEVKGANKENSALVSAQNVINKMHEAASKHDDPVAYLKHVTTSRSNPYLKAADDYRTALLNHFGHDVDHDTKDHRYEKDGHVVTLSEKDGKHTVEHAGYEEKEIKEDKVNPSKDHLATAIAKLGGLNSAEAKKQFDLTGKDFPAIKGALKKDGLDPDKLAELLAEHGYIRKDDNGKHDYDDFQDKLRRTATGDKVYSQERDAKDFEADLKKQEQEFIDSMALDDPPKEAVGYDDLHQSAQQAYASTYEEALAKLGKEATNKIVQMHQHDVPFGVKEYVDAMLRRAIDDHQNNARPRQS